MNRTAKIWLIVAASLVLVGCIIFVGVMAVLKWDFRKLSTNKYETNTYEINEAFKQISVDTDTADIVFVPTEGETASVVCYEQKNLKHTVTVNDGTLVIKTVDTRKWYEYIGINFGSPKITVYIPHGEYGALSVRTSTGDVNIPKGFSFKSIDVTLSTGDIKLGATVTEDIKINLSTGKTEIKGVSCKNLISDGSTGDIILNSVTVTDKIFVERDTGDVTLDNSFASEIVVLTDTGDVKLNRCDAKALNIETDTGDVSGHLLSGKVFVAESDTGKVKVPMPSGDNICKITTDTGDITFTVE